MRMRRGVVHGRHEREAGSLMLLERLRELALVNKTGQVDSTRKRISPRGLSRDSARRRASARRESRSSTVLSANSAEPARALIGHFEAAGDQRRIARLLRASRPVAESEVGNHSLARGRAVRPRGDSCAAALRHVAGRRIPFGIGRIPAHKVPSSNRERDAITAFATSRATSRRPRPRCCPSRPCKPGH